VRLARVVHGDSTGVYLELGDHLGSTSVVLDRATGELVQRDTAYAYGAAESSYRPEKFDEFREDYRFTGKEDDVEVGLIYFGKRYYAPLLQRWISPDPLAIHAPGQADLNLYAYVHGQTLRAVDPVGLECGVDENCTGDSATSFQPADEIPAHMVTSSAPVPDRAEPEVAPDNRFSSYQDTGQLASDPGAPEPGKLSETELGVAGFATGAIQGTVPGMQFAPSARPDSGTFEYWRGAGMTSAGVVEWASGAGLVAAGGTLELGTLGGATPIAVPGTLVGVGAMANGSVSIQQGQQVMVKADAESTNGSSGSRSTTSGSQRQPSTVDEVLANSRPGRATKGRTSQFERSGGFDQANADFDALSPTGVREIGGGGRLGTLPDGRTVIVRQNSSQGSPTLEVQAGKNKIKVRYDD
jgi:RHS repeat-associated protein